MAGQEAGQVGNAEKAGSALARQCARQGARVEKRWILGRGGGWQEVEVGKRWRLTRDGDWQEVEV